MPTIETPSEVKDEDASFWLTEIDAAKQRLDDWYGKADAAIQRYKDGKTRSFGSLNILWANTETQRAALGDDFGKPDVTRANIPDDGGLTRHISLLWQRAIDAATKDSGDNHEIRSAVHDVLLPGRGQVWLELNPVTDEAGAVSWVDAPLVRVPYGDYLEGPATAFKSVPWVARAHLFMLDDLTEMLAESKIDPKAIPRSYELPMPDGDKSRKWVEENKGKEQFKRARVWEIWARFPEKRRVYVAEGFNTALKITPDPYRLKGFFPCPRPIVANGDESWQVPITDYSRYEDQALELDRVSQRIFVYTELLRRRGVRNKKFAELADLPNADDHTLIAVESWAELAQAGGLNQAVQWEDLTQVTAVLQGLMAQRDKLIALIYELTGISDLARGQTDPNETLGAQKLKVSFGSGRFSDRQKESRRFASEAYAIKAELLAEHFPREQLAEMSGMLLPTEGEIQAARSFLQSIATAQQTAQQSGIPMPPISPDMVEQQKRVAEIKFSWEKIAGVIQSDRRRSYRVGMETDQTQYRDEEADKSSRIEFFGAFNQVLQTMMPAIQGNPANGEVIKELIMFVLSSFRVGRAMEENIEQAIDNAIKAAIEQKGKPQQPQGDPVQQAQAALIGAQAQKAQLDVQTAEKMGAIKVQIEQINLQIKQEELRIKQQEVQTKAIGQQIDVQAKAMKAAPPPQIAQQPAQMGYPA
jgi:hypothetical protein